MENWPETIIPELINVPQIDHLIGGYPAPNDKEPFLSNYTTKCYFFTFFFLSILCYSTAVSIVRNVVLWNYSFQWCLRVTSIENERNIEDHIKIVWQIWSKFEDIVCNHNTGKLVIRIMKNKNLLSEPDLPSYSETSHSYPGDLHKRKSPESHLKKFNKLLCGKRYKANDATVITNMPPRTAYSIVYEELWSYETEWVREDNLRITWQVEKEEERTDKEMDGISNMNLFMTQLWSHGVTSCESSLTAPTCMQQMCLCE